MREILHSDALPPTPYLYSCCIKTGPFYHMAGMIGLCPEVHQVISGGPFHETLQILENLKRALPDFSLNLSNLVATTIYTTEFDQFAAINQAWEQVFTSEDVPPPVRTSIGVAALPMNAGVEMEFKLYKE